MVASVYGVGSESQWVELDVLEEQDVVLELNQAVLVFVVSSSF